jgi:MORN repeat
MSENLQIADPENVNISKMREKLAQKNGSHATFYYSNGDRYLGEWKVGCREGFIFLRQEEEHIITNKVAGSILANGREIVETDTEFYQFWKSKAFLKWPRFMLEIGKMTKNMVSELIFILTMLCMKVNGSKITAKDGVKWLILMVIFMKENGLKGIGMVLEHFYLVIRKLILANGDKYEGTWLNNEKEGPGKFTYLSKRQCYTGEWSQGQARCGTITNLSPLTGQPGTLYAMPIIGLEDPQGIIDTEIKLLSEARLAKGIRSE